MSRTRSPGFLQGIMLLLPITLAVMGVSLLTTFVPMINEHFKGVPHYAYPSRAWASASANRS